MVVVESTAKHIRPKSPIGVEDYAFRGVLSIVPKALKVSKWRNILWD